MKKLFFTLFLIANFYAAANEIDRSNQMELEFSKLVIAIDKDEYFLRILKENGFRSKILKDQMELKQDKLDKINFFYPQFKVNFLSKAFSQLQKEAIDGNYVSIEAMQELLKFSFNLNCSFTSISVNAKLQSLGLLNHNGLPHSEIKSFFR